MIFDFQRECKLAGLTINFESDKSAWSCNFWPHPRTQPDEWMKIPQEKGEEKLLTFRRPEQGLGLLGSLWCSDGSSLGDLEARLEKADKAKRLGS